MTPPQSIPYIKNYDTFYLSGGYDDSMDVQI